MIKRWFNKIVEALTAITPSAKAKADLRHWYLVDKIAELEVKVGELENAAYRASKNS